jgi:putative peptidoglycan lipid II flippase
MATLLAGLLSAGLLVAVARPVGAFFAALDAGRDDPAGAAALAAIPATLVAVAPGIAALSAIGLLSRASYVRGRARSAGLVVALGWAATTILPLAAIAPQAGPGEALRLIALGTSLGLLVAAVILSILVRRAWGPGALHVPARTLLAGLLGTAATAAAGWWLGGRWEPTSLVGAALACAALGLGALLAFGSVATAIDPSLRHGLLRRLRPQPVRPEEAP